jgi:hypothetical protein
VIKPTAAALLKINTKREEAAPIIVKEFNCGRREAAYSKYAFRIGAAYFWETPLHRGSAYSLEINWNPSARGEAANLEKTGSYHLHHVAVAVALESTWSATEKNEIFFASFLLATISFLFH